MSQSEYTENRREDLEINGDVISTKKIYEVKKPNKKFLWIDIDRLKVIIELTGVILIVIAIMQYCNKIGDDKHSRNREIYNDSINHIKNLTEIIREHKSDSVSAYRYYIDQLTALKSQQAVDSQIKLKQIEITGNQIQSQNDLEFRRQQMERTFANAFEQIYLQKENEIDKERREYFIQVLTKASQQMEIINYRLHSPPEYTNAKEVLYLELIPKVRSIGDSQIIQKIYEYRYCLSSLEKLKAVESLIDTIIQINNKVVSYVVANIITIKNIIFEKKSDTVLYYDAQALKLETLNFDINFLLNEILNPRDYKSYVANNNLISTIKSLHSSIYSKVEIFSREIKGLSNILKNKSRTYPKDETGFKNLIRTITDPSINGNIRNLNIINYQGTKDILVNEIQSLKEDYNLLMFEKVNFLREGNKARPN